MQARRTAAAERFAAATLPTDAEEVWRYSRIGRLDLGRYTLLDRVLTTSSAVPGDSPVRVSRLSEHPDGAALLGSVVPPTDAFADLAEAALVDGVVVDVPDGVVLDEPLRIAHHLDAAGALAATRVVVRLGADSQVTVVEESSSAGVDALVVPVVELDLGPGARLRYVSVQDLAPAVWQIGEQASRTARDATLRTMAVALGGDYARLRTDATLDGRGGYNELLAVYFGEGSQMHDFRTIQHHVAPSTTSDLLFKGAVEDEATSVYSGLIRIGREAKGSRANQTNRNLILSDTASAESVPNLEILNNDVKCSHASAVGPIEDDHRYYLESRGVPPEAAERLIVLGFFGELLDRVPVPALAQRLHAAVAAKLDRRSR